MIAAHGLERFVSDVIIEGAAGDAASYASSRMTGRMTVIARVYLRWPVAQGVGFGRLIRSLGCCVMPLALAARLARRWSGMRYRAAWRKQAMSVELSGVAVPALPSPLIQPVPCFAAVETAEPEQPSPRAIAERAGQIGIELSSGIRLTVDPGVDADTLARVLAVVGR